MKKGNVVQTYRFLLQLQRRVDMLTAKEAGAVNAMTLTPAFNRNVFAYDATAAATARA